MKKISLQWRITLMTAILIGITCVSMNSLIGYSGRHYMDSIGSDISANSDSYKGEQEFFDPESADLDQEHGRTIDKINVVSCFTSFNVLKL